MSTKTCTDCPIDVDSEECRRCRDSMHKEQFKKKVNLSIFPTVSAGHIVVRGSEDNGFLTDKKK